VARLGSRGVKGGIGGRCLSKKTLRFGAHVSASGKVELLLLSCAGIAHAVLPRPWLELLIESAARADHVQLESSERVKMLEKQRCRAGCVNPCERNTL
jgi:hypothetical protein